MQLWALLVDSFRDAKDRKVFWLMIMASVVIAASMACIGFTEEGIDIMFGTFTIETMDWSVDNDELPARLGAVMVKVIADNYLGWLGIIVCLVATASAFPSLMESGNIDIVASKPISRHALFLGRYLGTMVFILVQAAIFVGLTFVVMGVRWGYWSWGYLWLIPLMVLLFSYLFAFCALFGVVTRRAITSLMLTMVVWCFIFLIQTAHSLLLAGPSDFDKSGYWQRRISAIHWIVPKTQDIAIIGGKLVGAGVVADAIPVDEDALPEKERAEFHRAVQLERTITESVDIVSSIGSSLGVEAVIVLLAMWRFNRRDF